MNNPETNPVSLFFQALIKNHIGLIATSLVLTSCYLWVVGKPFPDMLGKIDLIVISFLFGSKVGGYKE